MILHNKAAAGYVNPGFDTDAFNSVEETRIERLRFIFNHLWNKIVDGLTNTNDYDIDVELEVDEDVDNELEDEQDTEAILESDPNFLN